MNKLIKFLLQGKQLALSLAVLLLFGVATSAQETRTLKGTVRDKSGETLIGVGIQVKGTNQVVTTDFDGNYSLPVTEGSTLVFSYMGHIGKQIKIGKETTLNLTLEEDTDLLDEVIIVGYGKQKKANLTGAVTQVTSKVFETRPVTSAVSALQGAMTGVNIAPSSGNPNDDLSFNIRGTTSINGGGPLVLVDGVEMDLKLINPNDIESVSVLKDAAASSIYGVRAAFGVVLITTKKGTSGKLVINYSGNFSLSKATVMPEFVDNSYDHAMFINAAIAREGSTQMYPEEQLIALKAYAEDNSNPEYYINSGGDYVFAGHTDWVDMLIRKFNPKQSHNVSISGGSGNTKFYSSVGYTRQEGVFEVNPDVFKRLNTRLNVENQTYKWMKLGFRTLFNVSSMDEPHKYKDDIWHQIVFSSPIRPNKWMGDPNYPQYDKYIGKYFENQNPLSLLDLGGRNNLKSNEVVLTPTIDLTPIENWNIHADFNFSKSGKDNTYHRKSVDMINQKFQTSQGNTNNNSFEVVNSNKEYYSLNLYTDYERTIAEKHYFKAMVGYNQELTKYKTHTAKRYGLLTEEKPSLGLAEGNHETSDDGYEWALRGGFARLNYIYDNRYLVEVNGRYDGTSRFPSNNRFVFLPSFSLAWRLSEEKFMSFSRKIFDDIKFRVSYGRLGNQLLTSSSWTGNTRYYTYTPFLPNALTQHYLFGGQKQTMLSNPKLTTSDLTWEESSTINGGIDLTLLKSRLDIVFEIFERRTDKMLVSQEIPELLGEAAPVANKGELKTNGWELSVKWRDRIGSDFSYNVGLVLYDSKSKISKYRGTKGTVTGNYVGKNIGEIWGYETEGIFQTDEEAAAHAKPNFGKNWIAGDIKYRDLDDNDKIDVGANTPENPGDQKVIGNTTPRYSYGITAGASYKGIFFNIMFQGVGKRDFWPSAQAFWPAATQYFNTQKWFITDSWTPENPNAYFGNPRTNANDQNRKNQTKFLQDASYVRLKTLTVGYNLPEKWVSKIRLSRAQIYFSGENLWEHSNIKGAYDPESAAKSGTMAYPFQRVFSLGVDLTF